MRWIISRYFWNSHSSGSTRIVAAIDLGKVNLAGVPADFRLQDACHDFALLVDRVWFVTHFSAPPGQLPMTLIWFLRSQCCRCSSIRQFLKNSTRGQVVSGRHKGKKSERNAGALPAGASASCPRAAMARVAMARAIAGAGRSRASGRDARVTPVLTPKPSHQFRLREDMTFHRRIDIRAASGNVQS